MVCFEGACCDHGANCKNKECGDDGCGGWCGECPDDTLDCTVAICQDGKCSHVPDSVHCLVSGECVASGILNPDNSCETCNPTRSVADWIAVADGTPCAEGEQFECQLGKCLCKPDCKSNECGPDGCDGVCGECDDGVDCTADDCVQGKCVHEVEDTFCLIELECVPEGTAKPGNSCQACLPDLSSAGWSPVEDGQPCPGGAQNLCKSGDCKCFAACDGKECGDDGCGSVCGQCPAGQPCQSGQCYSPELVWSQPVYGIQNASVAIAPNDTVLLAGTFIGYTSLAGAEIQTPDGGSGPDGDVFVAALDESGTFQWGSGYGSSVGFDKGFDNAWSMAFHGPDSLYVVGNFGYAIDFGGGELTASGYGKAYAATLDLSGNHVWSKVMDPPHGVLYDCKSDSTGNLFAAGAFTAFSVCSGGMATVCLNIWVARLTPDGETAWERTFGPDNGGARAQSVAVTPAGKVAITGYYRVPELVLDGVVLAKEDDKEHVVLAMLDSGGTMIWATDRGDVPPFKCQSALESDSTGSIVSYRYCPDSHMYLEKWSHDGEMLWQKLLLLKGQVPANVAHAAGKLFVDSSDAIYVLGDAVGWADPGGGALYSGNDTTTFLAKLSPDGNHLWSIALDNDGVSYSVAVAEDGTMVVLAKESVAKFQQ